MFRADVPVAPVRRPPRRPPGPTRVLQERCDGMLGQAANRIATALTNVRKATRAAGRADSSWTFVLNLNPDTLARGGDFRYSEDYDRQPDDAQRDQRGG